MVKHEDGRTMKIVQNDFQEELIKALVKAGTKGILQGELYKKVMSLVSPEQMRAELEALLADDRVQRFAIERTTLWRATIKIYKRSV
jgi:hypothetical protein